MVLLSRTAAVTFHCKLDLNANTMVVDPIELFQELEEIEQDLDDEEEVRNRLAAATVAAHHGKNHCCAVPCRTGPSTGDETVRELLQSHHHRRCREVLRMPYGAFEHLEEYVKNNTSLKGGKTVSLEAGAIDDFSIRGWATYGK